MNQQVRAIRKTEMAFFRKVQALYDSTLDHCGNIRESLSVLKMKLKESGDHLPPAKWARLYGALMSGEIKIGKKSTPGNWASQEARLLKPPRC